MLSSSNSHIRSNHKTLEHTSLEERRCSQKSDDHRDGGGKAAEEEERGHDRSKLDKVLAPGGAPAAQDVEMDDPAAAAEDDVQVRALIKQ